MTTRTLLEIASVPGALATVEDLGVTTGSRFFVHSGTGTDGTGYGSHPDRPVASISYALGLCTASKGDIIYAMPGHVETIAAAGTLACSKIGVKIIGLGERSNRPLITLAGTDSVIAISAASVVLKNLQITCSIDEVVKAISVTAAFATIDQVDYVETATKQLIQFLLTSALATDLIIRDCVHHQSTAPAANSLWIQLVGADRAKIERNRIFITTTNSASSSVIESDTTAPVNILIKDNIIVQLGGASVVPVSLVAGTSGFVDGNRVASPKTAIAGSIALASCYGGLNYAAHVVNKNGLLEPVVDA
jgi:hypothetical protein